jgi:hypothetical protein
MGYLMNGKWINDPSVYRLTDVRETETRTPYRLVIVGDRYRPVREYKRWTKIELASVAWMGWTETQAYQEARLPSAGSFLYPGIHAVRRAAMEAFSQPNVRQVSVRTNQDKRVYLFNRHADGQITGYRPEEN